MKDSLDTDYQSNLDRMWVISSDRYFLNGNPNHARMILESFLANAKKRVCIFSECLSSPVFDSSSFITALKSALTTGVRVEIISQKDPQAKTLMAFSKTEESYLDHLSIKKSDSLSSDIEANFATVDGIGFRLEEDRTMPKAVACVNAPEQAFKLERFFDSMSLQTISV